MDGRAKLCWMFMGVLVILLVVVGYRWRKKLVFREVLIGTLLYVVGKMALYQAVYSFIVQGTGVNFSEVQQAVIASVLDAVVLTVGYCIVFKMFYPVRNSVSNVISVAFGEMLSEMVAAVGYSLLSYGLIFQAIQVGNATEIFTKQGLEQNAAATMVKYFEQISTASLVMILIRGISIIIVQIIAALLIYYGQQQKKKCYIACACLTILIFNLNNQVISMMNLVLAIVVFLVLAVGYLWYAEMKNGSVVGLARKE